MTRLSVAAAWVLIALIAGAIFVACAAIVGGPL